MGEVCIGGGKGSLFGCRDLQDVREVNKNLCCFIVSNNQI